MYICEDTYKALCSILAWQTVHPHIILDNRISWKAYFLIIIYNYLKRINIKTNFTDAVICH